MNAKWNRWVAWISIAASLLGGGLETAAKSVTKNGVILRRYESGGNDICWGSLEKDTLIQGFPSKGGFFHSTWFNGDSLFRFDAYKFVVQDDIEIPAGSRVTLYHNGRLRKVSLPRDWRIRGYLCKAKQDDWSCGFFQNGKISRFIPAERIEIDGILCEKETAFWQEHDVYLHQNGRLKSTVLAKDTEIDSKLHKKETA